MKTIAKINEGLYASNDNGLTYVHAFYDMLLFLKLYDVSIDDRQFVELSRNSICIAINETVYTISFILASNKFDFADLSLLANNDDTITIEVMDIFAENNRVNIQIAIDKPTEGWIYEHNRYNIDDKIKQDDI